MTDALINVLAAALAIGVAALVAGALWLFVAVIFTF